MKSINSLILQGNLAIFLIKLIYRNHSKIWTMFTKRIKMDEIMIVMIFQLLEGNNLINLEIITSNKSNKIKAIIKESKIRIGH